MDEVKLLPCDEEALILLMLAELHANVPEADRPMSMSDLSDDQAQRARNAVRKVIVASLLSAPAGRFTSIAELERAIKATRPTTVVTGEGHAGFFVAAEEIMHFINALDSEGMDANAVRSAIYHKCLEMRPS